MTRHSSGAAGYGTFACRATAATALIACVAWVAVASGAQVTTPAGVIVFNAKVGGVDQLFTIRPDGTGRRQLTKGTASVAHPAWSPDARRIAFERSAAKGAAIAMIDADGGHLRVLTPTGYQGQPSFAPDGRTIVYNRDLGPTDNGIWVMGADGRDPRRLTRNRFMRDGMCGCDELPRVSPDGRRVAFLRVKVDGKEQGLFTVGTNGKGLRRVLPYTPGVWRVDWSPDGTRLAISRYGTASTGGSANVYTVRPDGTDLRPVTRLRGGAQAFLGAYSPDGKWLLIQMYGGGKDGAYIVRPDGTGLRRLLNDADESRAFDWGVAR